MGIREKKHAASSNSWECNGNFMRISLEVRRKFQTKIGCGLFPSSSPWVPYNCCAKVSKSAVPISSAR